MLRGARPFQGCLLAALAFPALAVAIAPAEPASGDTHVAPHTTVIRAAPRAAPASASTAQSPVVLGSINVTAQRPDVAARAQQRLTPGAVHIVNAETFYQRPVSNMADALRYVPGVSIQSNTGGDSAVLSIRGSNLSALGYDNSGVALFENGLPVTTADGANHNRLLDPLTARSVIVADGPNALSYGASDLGGAIDFISRTARNSDPNQVYVMGGEHTLFNGRVSAGGVSGNFDGIVTVDGKHFSGYQQHSRENRASVYGNAGWRLSPDVHLRVFATWIDSRQQLAGSLTRAEFDADPRQADPSYVLGNHQLNVKTGRLAAKGTWKIDTRSWLEFGLSYEGQSLYHPIVDVYDFSTRPPAHFFSLLINTYQRTAGAMVRYHLTLGDHKLLAGVNLAQTTDTGGNYDNDQGRRGSRTDDVDQHARNATVFVLDRWTFAPRWTFVYGAQGVVTDRNVIDVSLADGTLRDQKRTYSAINPRLGVIYALASGSELYANASRVYEPPNNFDLDNDVHKNDTTQYAMHGTSYEIGTRGTGALGVADDTWHWNVSLYYARIRDEILSVEDPTEPGNMLSTNYPRTIHAGVSALLGASFELGGGNRITPLVSASWNDFSFDHDPEFGNHRLPSAPRYVVHGEVMYHNARSGFYAGPTLDWVGARYADMANTYRVRGYFLTGLRVGIQRNDWQLFAEARNLANKHYVNAVTVLTQADADARVLNAGAPRSLFVGMRVRY